MLSDQINVILTAHFKQAEDRWIQAFSGALSHPDYKVLQIKQSVFAISELSIKIILEKSICTTEYKWPGVVDSLVKTNEDNRC